MKGKIGIVGTGTIGACLGTLIIGNGYEAVMIAYSEEEARSCIQRVEENFQDLVERTSATEENKVAAMNLLKVTCDYEELKDIDFIFEATLENISVKKEVYSKIEKVCSKDTIIASTTSSITAQELSRYITIKSRLIVAHPFQPAHLLPLVELVGSSHTDPSVLEQSKKVLEDLKRQVVILKRDIPGFIVNRLAQAMFRESLNMVEQGVASVEDIDKSIKYAVGMRYASIGLLEYFDAVGFELERDIASNVYPDLCNTTEIQDIVETGIKNGTTGLKAGKGLYNWENRSVEDFMERKDAPYIAAFDWDLPTKK